MGSALMPIEGLFLLPASIQAKIIVKGIRRNETVTIKTVRDCAIIIRRGAEKLEGGHYIKLLPR